ncbi:MAG: diacylglycerol/polyprenol kinase family protein [Candidatus Hodarchaeota archaeon]
MQILPAEFALIQDILVLIVVLIVVLLFITFTYLMRKRGIISQYFSRKLIHICAGPTFVLSFIFYSGSWFSPYIASILPGIFALLFFLIGVGIIENEYFVHSMSRSGDPRELLRGTFYYACAGGVVTLFFWTTYPPTVSSSPVSIVIFSTLAIGDGFADIVGRKVNRMNFKILAKKSVPGTLSMFISSIITCIFGFLLFGFDLQSVFSLSLAAILFTTLVEAVSPRETDNITIPIAVILTFVVLTPLLSPTAPWSVFHIHLP